MDIEKLKGKNLQKTYLIYPHWGVLFFLIGGFSLLVIGVIVRIFIGLSASSDMVFAVEAFISGLLTEIFFFRVFLKRSLVVAPKIEIPFLYIWILLCLYVFICRPFE